MLITDKKELINFSPEQRIWQGIPSIEVTSGGKIFYTFYSGGIKEQFGNYCLLKRCNKDFSDNELIAVEFEGDSARSYDPCLWIDPLGRLWWFWGVMPKHATYASICANPDADKLVFSKPFKVGYDVMLNKPTVLSTGEWLFPLAVWGTKVLAVQDCPTLHRDRKAFVYKSINNGESIAKLGGAVAYDRSFDEHMVIEKNDGSLVMYIRTHYGIAKSQSFDGGKNWTDPVNSWLGGPDSRFFIRRLKSGRLLLINHYKFKGRNNLVAMLSEDDGETWIGNLMLDERDNVSYPDAVEASDGFIYVTYDRDRGAFLRSLSDATSKAREILIAKITEEDILQKKLVTKGSVLKVVVDKLGEYKGTNPNPYEIYQYKDKNEYVRKLAEISDGKAIVEKLLCDYGRCCVSLSKEDRKCLDDNCAVLTQNSSSDDLLSRVVAIEKIISVLGEEITGDAQYTSYLIERVKTAVAKNIGSVGFGLNELADELNISKFYMSHLFKKKTGTTVLQYINYCKLAEAKKMLIQTERTVLSIAMAVGFIDVAYFSKWFKKAEGMSPMTYRNLNKIKVTE